MTGHYLCFFSGVAALQPPYWYHASGNRQG